MITLLAALLTAALAATPTPPILTAEIRGTIDPATSDYLIGAIRRAEEAEAQALVVELDTPGGLVSSVRQMAQAIDQSKVPVIVYTSPAGASATSAGALLMLASHLAAMAPGTNIGAAHPVGSGGEDIKGALGEKAVNDTAAFARGLAEVRGRNREIAEAVVAKSKSFTAEEAVKEHLIEIVAPDRATLLNALQGRTLTTHAGPRMLHTAGAPTQAVEMTPGQKLLHTLAHPNIAAILISVGMLLIYMELSAPGITIAGVLGGICILVGFIALQMLPIRDGALALIALGIVLMAAEPFVTSHGAFAAGGILALVLGLIWLMDPGATELRISPAVWIPIALGLGGMTAIISVAAARTWRLARRTRASMGGGGPGGLAGYEALVSDVAEDGRTGTAMIRGELWSFRSESPLRPGDRAEVTGASDLVVTLRRS